MTRCAWAGSDPIYIAYHDTEWGVPERDGRALWEKLILDGFQAGLSWITILKKRENFRTAFNGFRPEAIADWGEAEVLRCLADPGIIRHRGKIEATIGNARAYLALGGAQPFADLCWSYVGGQPVQNAPASMQEVPAATEVSTRFSKDLKKAGFKFCGPTIVYAWMQACGLVNDHLANCPRCAEVARMG
ncbi:DNA-3-methyladenine glycosylase I [Roseisalinus antarcticus]|uniref:DNA-3-methyladenine glycosylase I n=1 Tax=Roseisalinus antarcticus TaxID=254357 RepID=A0A1Y5RPK4_9RHOB|nr:DNA-3-methyladenine glycosylase I [Roseisalinus antarcticus]SLN21211.1 DNA-3-methyladenine glycosylase 1 [Roseisalinus antarcticus]